MSKNNLMKSTLQTPPWRKPAGKILLVLPAYNEEKDLGILLQRIDDALYNDGLDYLVIIVDDGSSDRTVQVAEDHAKYMPILIERHSANEGLGSSIRDGLKAACAICCEQDIIVAMDADNTHTPRLIRSMTRAIQEGSDVVIASRYQRGSYIRGVPLHRRFFSLSARFLFQIFFPIKGLRDYTCGYRAYRGAALKEAFRWYGDQFINQEGFQCMVDILLKLRGMDMIFREVPLILRYDLKGGASKMKISRTIILTLALMIRRRLDGKGIRLNESIHETDTI